MNKIFFIFLWVLEVGNVSAQADDNTLVLGTYALPDSGFQTASFTACPLYKYPSKKTNTSYFIPNSVTEIATGAFDSATNLNTLTFSNNTIIIRSNTFKNSELTTVIINESTNINNIDLYVGTNQPFYGNKSNVNVSVNTKILFGIFI